MSNRIIKMILDVLISENYSYNIVSDGWKKDKAPIDEMDVVIAVIHWARKNTPHMREKGVFAEAVVKKAKQMPAFTHASFIKKHIRRVRGKRIAGKYLFEKWCKEVRIKIIGTLEDFIPKNSLIVAQFYDYLANGATDVIKRARVLGELLSSVFVGLELKEEEEILKRYQASNPLIRRCSYQRRSRTQQESNEEGIQSPYNGLLTPQIKEGQEQ